MKRPNVRDNIIQMINEMEEVGCTSTDGIIATSATMISTSIAALTEAINVQNEILYDLTYKTEVMRREEKRDER